MSAWFISISRLLETGCEFLLPIWQGIVCLCEKNSKAAILDSVGELSSGPEVHSWLCPASADTCSLMGSDKLAAIQGQKQGLGQGTLGLAFGFPC